MLNEIKRITSNTEKPWIFVTNRSISNIFCKDFLFELDGKKMKSLENAFYEFSKKLLFPKYFGNNLDSFDECICDLSWIPKKKYIIYIKNASCFLCKEKTRKKEIFLSTLSNAGEEWAKPIIEGEIWDRKGIPFHTILETKNTSFLKLNNEEFKIPLLPYLASSSIQIIIIYVYIQLYSIL